MIFCDLSQPTGRAVEALLACFLIGAVFSPLAKKRRALPPLTPDSPSAESQFFDRQWRHVAGVNCICYHAQMKLNGKCQFVKYYHTSKHLLQELVDEGLPFSTSGKMHRGTPGYVFDTVDVDAWMKENGINLSERSDSRSTAHRYITVEQAKQLFPHNPAMALIYAIFCTKDDYVKHFRRIDIDA